jgi:hypothetical protein
VTRSAAPGGRLIPGREMSRGLVAADETRILQFRCRKKKPGENHRAVNYLILLARPAGLVHARAERSKVRRELGNSVFRAHG